MSAQVSITADLVEVVGVPRNGVIPIGQPVRVAVHCVKVDGVETTSPVVTAQLMDEDGDGYWDAVTLTRQPSGAYEAALNVPLAQALIAGDLYTVEVRVTVGGEQIIVNLPYVAGRASLQ